VCVCVCVCERERERGIGIYMHMVKAIMTYQNAAEFGNGLL